MAAGGFLPQTVQSSDADAVAKVEGSFLLIQADTAEQAWETLKKDVFWTSGEVVRQLPAITCEAELIGEHDRVVGPREGHLNTGLCRRPASRVRRLREC